jgi:hypothetical protein
MSEFSAVPTTNEEEEEEDDDLFEDATEEPVQDDVVMDEVPEQEQEAEGEAEEEEEEGEEEENDAKQGGESGGEDNELLQQLEDSMMREDEDGRRSTRGCRRLSDGTRSDQGGRWWSARRTTLCRTWRACTRVRCTAWTSRGG